jgi:hypothetical protein
MAKTLVEILMERDRTRRNGQASQPPPNGRSHEHSEAPPLDDVATLSDLRAAGAQISWLWEGWIQTGVVTALGAKAGTGKTRFIADLVRRIRHGLPWPDNQPMTLPPDTRTLWVLSDHHHDELVSLARAFAIEDSIWLNASKKDPWGGVMLETLEDFHDLEGRIQAVRPKLVIVDTVGNATGKNLCRQEEARDFYAPLQLIARRSRAALLCLTHLNQQGTILGRRALEKVRVALCLTQPDEAKNHRRLEVQKSNSRRPAALGVVMNDGGNAYDTNPPEPGQGGGGRAASDSSDDKLGAVCAWLQERLLEGPERVQVIRNEAEEGNLCGAATLYRAKGKLGIEEYTLQGKKWWRLRDEEADQAQRFS